MRQTSRLWKSLVSLGLLGTVGAIGAGPAQAWSSPDPQTANVPYLAWRGEQVRLVKCVDSDQASDASGVEFLVEEWSGNQGQRPQAEAGTGALYRSSDGRICGREDFVTNGDGLARIKMVISNGSQQAIVKHQFLAGWMTLGTPSLREVASSELGDPSGNGVLDAGGKDGRLSVTLKGTVTGFNGEQYTLPDDWAALAKAYADDDNPADTDPAARWDIHDDQSDREGHAGDNACTPRSSSGVDAVDNCTGGGAFGPFSTVFGMSSDTTIGPFDPLRPDETLLSDGKLDAGDAPMPAARIDVSIASNQGGSDIGGIGSLESADKQQVYSRDLTGATTGHNLYAPFYSAYLPATSAPSDVASGIDGPASGNNFAGFLVNGRYDYWKIAADLGDGPGGSTQCNWQFDKDHQAQNRNKPSGAQRVAVYTDEHGEAQVLYNPGTAAFYDQIPGVVKNANGGCDLQGVSLIGTSAITATAKYPYQPVSASSTTSNTVYKQVRNYFSKTLSYYAKGTGEANSNARIVVAHAQDVDGSPFAGEKVCFARDYNGAAIQGFFGTVNGIDLSGSSPANPPKSSDGLVCVRTDAHGNAGVEVYNSNGTTVDVPAVFYDEGILRDIKVDFGTSGSQQSNPSPTGSGTSQSGGSGSTSGSTPSQNVGNTPSTGSGSGTTAPPSSVTQSSGLSQTTSSTTHKSTSKSRVHTRVTFRVYKRALRLKVRSSHSRVTVRIVLRDRHHHVVHKATRRIKANRQVMLHLGSMAKVRSVSIRVLR